jgi:predicted thioesterase
MDFSNILKPGLKAEETDNVTARNIASAWGSGGHDVFATPAMIALMETASLFAVQPFLPQGWSTVGTEVNIRHISPTPPGMKVRAEAELISIDGRALLFKVEAFDETGKIGEGTHGRFIIEIEKFLAKTNSKMPVT